MRGFGANQVAFALESCIDDICKQAGFDRWKFRYDNALVDGLTTSTGQKLKGVGIRACLDAVKDDFYKAKYSGLACAIKNSGVGNGMNDAANAIATIVATRALSLRQALLLSAIANFVGPFLLGVAVAETIGKGIISIEHIQPLHIVALLISAIFWTYLATWKGLPISVTHSIIGGLLGIGLAINPATINIGKLSIVFLFI